MKFENGHSLRGQSIGCSQRWKDAQENAQDFLNTFPDSLFRPEIYWSRPRRWRVWTSYNRRWSWYEKSLTELQQQGNPDPSFEATLFMDRGRLLERLNRTSDALESFLRVAIIYDHPALTPEALYRSIRCHKILKEESEARTLLDELQQRYLDSPWTQKAKAEFENGQAQPASPGEPVSKGQSMKP
jgi:tetratricopeptide (TPR) repeat protein